MPGWTFDFACAYIDSYAGRGWRLGLDRMETFMQRAGLYEFAGRDGRCSFLHVAGTNGKGTTTAILESILAAAGFKSGGTYSPYVLNVRERIRVQNANVPEQLFAQAAEALAPVAEAIGESELGLVTEFEFKTAMAFWIWRATGREWVAAEVGLGGRLDATNVLSPSACAIVSIGMDHMAFLGDTETAIASEKAGILKRGVPAVIGDVSPEARRAITSIAHQVGASLWTIGEEVRYEPLTGGRVWIETPGLQRREFTLPSFGPFSAHNTAVALATLEAAGLRIDDTYIQAGLNQATLLGRFQRIDVLGVPYLLDGAHNAASAQALASALTSESVQEPLHLVCGMLEGHDPRGVLVPLLKCAETVTVSPIQFHRGLPAKELSDHIALLGYSSECAVSLHEALELAGAKQRAVGGTIVVTGSFYLVGEVLSHLAKRSQDMVFRSGIDSQ